MTRPEVSILIPVHRPDDDFISLLRQLVSQRFPVPHEVLIVQDGTPLEACVERRADFQAIRFPFLSLYRLMENQGPAAARNYGLLHAQGRVFFLIDSDCKIKDDLHLQKLYDCHQEYPHSVLGGGIQGEGTGLLSFFERYCDYTNVPGSKSGPIDPGNHLRTSHMVIPRAVWEKVGPFDPRLRTGEDKAFCLQCLQNGIELRLHSSIVIFHRDRATWGSVLLRQIEIGKYRAACRASALGSAPWYLTCSRTLRIFLAPFVATALTFLYFVHWIARDVRVVLALPGMWVVNLALAFGVVLAKVPPRSKRGTASFMRTLPLPLILWQDH